MAVIIIQGIVIVGLCAYIGRLLVRVKNLKKRNTTLLSAAWGLDSIFRTLEDEHTRWLQRVAAGSLTDEDLAEIERTRAAWRHDGPRWNRIVMAEADLWRGKGRPDEPKD